MFCCCCLDIQVIADSKYEIVQLLGDMKNKTEQGKSSYKKKQ